MCRNIDRNIYFIFTFLLVRFFNIVIYVLIICCIKRRLLEIGKYNEKGVNLFCIFFYKAKSKIKRELGNFVFFVFCALVIFYL